jgi:hypothetical protein
MPNAGSTPGLKTMTPASSVGWGSGARLRERCGLLLWLARSLLALAWLGGVATAEAAWSSFAENAGHTALSSVAAQPLEGIRWATPVDEAPPSGEILIHYGSPLVTPSNTVVIPVKTASPGGYRVDARSGQTGAGSVAVNRACT